MRLGPAAIAALSLGLALIFSACGDGDSAATGSDGAAREASRGASASGAAAGGCTAQLGDFVERLDRLRDDLAVGLSYEAYLGEVEGARAAYAGIPVGRLSLECLALAGNPAERALNGYISGVNTWGDCLAVAGCEPTSIEAELKRDWNLASDRVSAAQDGLRSLRRQGAPKS